MSKVLSCGSTVHSNVDESLAKAAVHSGSEICYFDLSVTLCVVDSVFLRHKAYVCISGITCLNGAE